MKLRPYQEKAVDAIFKSWCDFNKTLLVLPTGTGKTICFAKVAERAIESTGEKVLVLAHREELLTQARDKIHATTGLSCAFEKGAETALGSFEPITCASVQTLMRSSRLQKFNASHYGTIIVDEAHHALSDSYQNILNHFSYANVLGVTATPDRGDKKNLGKYFEDVAFEYGIRDAIKDGYLSKILVKTVPLKISLKDVKSTAGDFSADDLGNAIDPYLEEIAKHIPRDRKTLIFLPLIETSKRMTQILVSLGHKAEHIDGISHDRSEILERFHTGECGVLCNSMLLTEGFDEPSIDCIVCLRPTKIRSLYAQIVGRGTRLHSGKENLLILDFLWQTAQHDLCHAAHLIAPKEEIALKMREISEQENGVIDLSILEEQAESSAREERERSLVEAIKSNANKRSKLIDPIEYALSLHDDALEDYSPTFAWEKEKPTSRQVAILQKLSFDRNKITSRGYAAMLINRVISRRVANLATPSQIKTLEKFGIDEAGSLSFSEASRKIGEIAANGWRTGGFYGQ